MKTLAEAAAAPQKLTTATSSKMVVDSNRLNDHGTSTKAPSQETNGKENVIPASLGSPAADILRNFYHTKRVGNYLIGRKLGEGSFAKVREGLHALTGEKVRFGKTERLCFSHHGT